jgi:thiamine monophosphate synthase
VLGAGATRVCVLRAVSDAADPQAAARALRGALERGAT